jgi:hypothetical protein
MTDEQIEEMLRRYELRAPGRGLESRILTVAGGPPSVRLGVSDYRLLLAAAVLILAVVFTAPVTQRVPANAADLAWRAEVEAAAAAIGGDEQALKLAEMLVPRPKLLDLEEGAW